MSYAHTKRRKLIIKLKRRGDNIDSIKTTLKGIGDSVRRKQQGPLVGSLDDLLPKGFMYRGESSEV